MHTPSYDVAVIGSSPLLLMLALRLRRAGNTVVLFEADARLGGAWQVEEVEDIGPVECACHLIEWYAGGYEMLAELAGTSFVPCDPQPTRVFLNGRVAPYTSRFGIVRSALRAVFSLGLALRRVVIARHDERPASRARLAGAWQTLLFELRFRLPGVASFDAVRKPADGYVNFMEALCSQVEASGIAVVTDRVDGVDPIEAHAIVRHGTRHQTKAEKVFFGESARIEKLGTQASSGAPAEDYHHIVVGSPAAEVVLRSDYVHTPDDPIFHRVTYVRDHAPNTAAARAIFLVQLRRPVQDIPALDQELGILFRRCGIATNATDIIVYKVFSKQYMGRGPTVPPLRSGAVIQGVRTIGDLARNVVVQAETFKDQHQSSTHGVPKQ